MTTGLFKRDPSSACKRTVSQACGQEVKSYPPWHEARTVSLNHSITQNPRDKTHQSRYKLPQCSSFLALKLNLQIQLGSFHLDGMEPLHAGINALCLCIVFESGESFLSNSWTLAMPGSSTQRWWTCCYHNMCPSLKSTDTFKSFLNECSITPTPSGV